jgi:hypothetical protein
VLGAEHRSFAVVACENGNYGVSRFIDLFQNSEYVLVNEAHRFVVAVDIFRMIFCGTENREIENFRNSSGIRLRVSSTVREVGSIKMKKPKCGVRASLKAIYKSSDNLVIVHFFQRMPAYERTDKLLFGSIFSE